MPPDVHHPNPSSDRGESALGAAMRALPLLAPTTSAWPGIAAAIAARQARRRRQRRVGAFAAAAVLAIAVVGAWRIEPATPSSAPIAATTDAPAPDAAPAPADARAIAALIAQNQRWEQALRRADARPDALSGGTALASAEIEDMIGMIDVALADGDDRQARELWTQRARLMAELASLRNGSRAISALTDGSARLLPAHYAID